MELKPYELRSARELIETIATHVDLHEDESYLALVEAPSREQRLVALRRLALPALLEDTDNIREHLRNATRDITADLPDVRRPNHSLVTIVVRPGRCMVRRNELIWLNGWRYSNHIRPVFDSDMILVTEHGWHSLLTHESGETPVMKALTPG